MTPATSMMLFRSDLRITDNPALFDAVQKRIPLICLFVWDPSTSALEQPGKASRWWLYQSLRQFSSRLQTVGNNLVVKIGRLSEVVPEMIQHYHVTHVSWNFSYEPNARNEENLLRKWITQHGAQVACFNGNLLVDPQLMYNQKGTPYTIFTPFWNRLQKTLPGSFSIRRLNQLPSAPPPIQNQNPSTFLKALAAFDHYAGYHDYWKPGEEGAQASLKKFLPHHVFTYRSDRDRPDMNHTARLSPHLHFGEISPAFVWKTLDRIAKKTSSRGKTNILAFRRQLAWREFATHLLFHHPNLPSIPLKTEYKDFPWQSRATLLQAWQTRQTGYPIIDAGMRELLKTGWMHNRIRMVAASFLTKHLLLDWREGAKWFWETLVDADMANNTLGWQWAAGCGADAAPFFRIFNPMLQGKKFDPEGSYVRRWVPELSRLDQSYIHQPWEAPQSMLKKANVVLGKTYPFPIVHHRQAREKALARFQQFKSTPTIIRNAL